MILTTVGYLTLTGGVAMGGDSSALGKKGGKDSKPPPKENKIGDYDPKEICTESMRPLLGEELWQQLCE